MPKGDRIGRDHGGDDRDLELYLREIGKIPRLTLEEEKALAVRISSGDQKARNRLVESNLRFVVSIAKRYRNHRLSLLDLINEGNLGLLEAARRYDPERGVKFVTYAVWWIRQAIIHALAVQGYTVKLPLKRANLHYRIHHREQTLKQDLGRKPTSLEIADSLEEDERNVENVLRASRVSISLEVLSLEEEQQNYRLMSRLTQEIDSEDRMVELLLHNDIYRLLGQLTSREAEVIHLHFGLRDAEERLTLEEIGTRYGLTKEGVRQIEKKATAKLRLRCDQITAPLTTVS